jgi:type IV pilus secretin PilQ/predicted competence protein
MAARCGRWLVTVILALTAASVPTRASAETTALAPSGNPAARRGTAEPGAAFLERGIVAVTDVQVEGRGPDLISLVVTADGILAKYESFALPDPPRLVIDLPRARHKIARPVALPAGSPVVKVRTTQYRERPIPVVRLVLDLTQDLPYRLDISDHQLHILIGEAASEGPPPAREARPQAIGDVAPPPTVEPPVTQPVAEGEAAAPGEPQQAVSPEGESLKEQQAKILEELAAEAEKTALRSAEEPLRSVVREKVETPAARPEPPSETRREPAKRPRPLAAPKVPRKPPVGVTAVEVLARGPEAATILVTADGALIEYESFALPDPPRLVIDLSHARHAIRRPVVLPAASPIAKVRATQYRERPIPIVRVVLDLRRALPFTVERIDSGVKISLGEPEKAPGPPAPVAKRPPEDTIGKVQPPPVVEAPRRVVAKPKRPERRPSRPPEPPQIAEAPVPPAPAPAPPPPRIPPANNRLSLDFKNADIDDLLRLISEVSGLNVVAAHKLKGDDKKVTVRLMNVEWRQALDIILRTKELSYEQDGNVIYVGTKSEIQKAKEDRVKDIEQAEKTQRQLEEAAALRDLRVEETKKKMEREARLFDQPLVDREIRLNYTKPADMLKRVEPFKTARGKVTIDESLNALLVEDVESATKKMVEVAKRFDFPANEPILARTVTLNYARPSEVAQGLEPYRTSRGKLIPDDGRSTLLIEDYQSAASKMEALARGRDIPANEPILTKTATLNFARAADVAKRLEPLRTPRGKLIVDDQTNSIVIEDFQSAATKIEAFLRQLDRPEVDRLVTKLLPYNYAKAADVRANLIALKSPQGSVVVDERSSRVIVKDLPQAVERMESFLKQIDIPTPQVLIEARIVEASRSFTQSLGVQWGGAGVPTKPGSSTGVTTFGGAGNPLSILFPPITAPSPTSSPFLDPTNPIPFSGPVPLALNLPAIGTNPFVLGATIGSLANRFLVGAQLSVAEREGRIRTLSAPRIATQDNEEAEIKQGTQVPFTTIDASGRTVVSFQDAFIKLKVKPHITPDGRVAMKVEAERSFPGDRIDFSGGFAFPINTRKATTNILVQNGSTVVIGGLLQSTEQIATDQIPGLGRIPILGWLFKRRSEGPDERVELLIFLTPSILQESRT